MTDRTELLEAALDSLPDGIALVGAEGEVIFWNQAAQGITGYAAIDVLALPLPEGLKPLLFEEDQNGTCRARCRTAGGTPCAGVARGTSWAMAFL